MTKRIASVVLVVIALLAGFVLTSQSAAAQARGKRVSVVRQQKAPTPPPTNIGFLSATQIAAGGGTYSPFPAVMGDFNGDGKQDVATMVNTGSNAKPTLAISVILSNGDGTFSSAKTTATTYTSVVFNPMWVGNLNGVDDIIVGVQATLTTPASIDVYLSNGDGTFKSPVNYPVTNTNDVMVWGTTTKDASTGFIDFVAADGASPNGSVWTLTGKGDGTFNAATSVAFTGALQPGDPVLANSFNPIAFGDFNGDGVLDFAGASSTNTFPNQISVYIALNPPPGYKSPNPLKTNNNVYHSCYLTSGNLSGALDLVAANCFDGNVTVYVNGGSGTFPAKGVYSPAGAVPSGVTIADIDGDGNNDVVSANWQGADVTVLLGNGTGALSAPGPAFAIGGSAHINSPLTPALVADFNGDGHLDAVLQDSEFSFVYLQSLGSAPSTPPSFRSAIDYQFSVIDLSYSVGIASGDFNKDGIPDFVVGNGDDTAGVSTGVTVFLSKGDGTLQAGVPLLGTNPTAQLRYVAVADFDGDGNLDIAATDSVNGAVQIFAGDGKGNFTAYPTTFPTGTGVSAWGIAVGAFNGDTKPDLAVVNNTSTSDNVAILTNTSTPGSFAFTATQLTNLSGLGATEITAADLNNDGKPDLLVPMWGVTGTPGTNVAVYLGGNGSFGSEADVNLGFNNPYYATVGDFNGDGIPDLAVTTQDQTNNHNQGVAIALGKGNGTFQLPALFVLTSLQNFALDEPFPGYVKAVDLNRDGKQDLIYTNKKYGTVGILYGQGTGAFYDPVEFAAGAKAFDIAVADVNGDGALDVVASSNARDFVGVTVLLNTSADTTVQAPPSATNVSRGTPVTFSATVTGSTVKGVTAVPTGTVSFIDNGGNNLGSGPLGSGGVASVTSASLETGANSVVAQYSGDTNYLPSTSTAQTVQVSGQTGSATVVASSANPAALGASITFSATVTSTLKGDTLVPTGTVTFKDGSTVLGPGTIAKGVATFVTSTLAAGTHSITGVYGGDASFTGSTSAPLNQVVSSAMDYTLAATPTSATVNPGAAATFTITVAAVNGYNGVVSFSPSSCTGLPPESSCSFSPATVTGSGTTTLTITTTGPTAVLRAPSDVHHHSGGLNLWASLGGVGVLGMILAGEGKKRNRRRIGIVLTVLAVVMLLALVGCGGGSSSGGGGGGGGGGTPAGTSTIQLNVTGTINTATHHLTTPITLKVN